MNKYKQKCFELEAKIQEMQSEKIEIEKKYTEEKEKLQQRCHEAETKRLELEKEKLKSDEDYNVIYEKDNRK